MPLGSVKGGASPSDCQRLLRSETGRPAAGPFPDMLRMDAAFSMPYR